jgi:hypothetical protein
MREISGNLVTMAFSTNVNDPLNNLKTIVCEDSSDGGLDSTVNTTPTKCAVFSTSERPTGTINGSGVIITDPEADEASFQEVLDLANNGTRVYAVYQNAAESPDVVEGAGVFMAGFGRFNSARATAAQGAPTTYNWTFTFSGEIDTEYPASA